MREDDEALVAMVTFIRALRREWLSQALGGSPPSASRPCPAPEWKDIAPMDRMRFLRAMKSALASTKPDNLAKVIESVRAL